MDEKGKRLIRIALSAVPPLGSVWVVWLAWNDQLKILVAGVICVLAVLAVRSVPRGSKAAAWLFALWVGLTLAVVARVDLVEQLFAGDRTRLALAGGLTYLVLAGLGFWTCTGQVKRS